VDQDGEVVFAVAGEVGDNCFARFGQVAAPAAKGAFLKNLPAVGRYELMLCTEDYEVEVVACRFEKD